MSPIRRITGLGLVALAILAGSLACGRGKVPDTAGHQAAVQKAIQAAGGGSTGFVCAPTVDGNFVCMCWEGESDPLLSCDGMSRFCDIFDHGDLCNPDGTCSCRIRAVAQTP